MTSKTSEDSKLSPNLQSLSQEYASLRKQPSHFDGTGADFNPVVDASNSQKYKVMDELATFLDDGTRTGGQIIEVMGEPDEITANLFNPFQSPSFMPGPKIPDSAEGTEQPDVMYAVYHWRGRHDFLWFKVDQGTEKVLGHGWYKAME